MKILYRYYNKSWALDQTLYIIFKEYCESKGYELTTKYEPADVAMASPQNMINNYDLVNPTVYYSVEPTNTPRIAIMERLRAKTPRVFTMVDLPLAWHPVYEAPVAPKTRDSVFVGDRLGVKKGKTPQRRVAILKKHQVNIYQQFRGDFNQQLNTTNQYRFMWDVLGGTDYGNHIAWHRWLLAAGSRCVLVSESDGTNYGFIPGTHYLQPGDKLVYDPAMADRFRAKLQQTTQFQQLDFLVAEARKIKANE